MLRKLILAFFIILATTLTAHADNTAYADNFYAEMDALYRADNLDAVERRSEQELKLKPDSLAAYYFLAEVRFKRGQYEEAVPFMMKFEEYHDALEAREKAKLLKEKGEKDTEIILIDVWFVHMYYELGRYHFSKGDYTKSLEWLMRAKTRFQNDPSLHGFIGVSYMQTGEYKKAVKHLEVQYDQNSDDPSPLYNIACAYALWGKSKKAISSLARAIEANEDFRNSARSDKDFDNIRKSRRFIELVGG